MEAAWLERASGKVPGRAAWLAVSGSNRGVRRELACVAASGSGDEGTLEWVEDGDGGGVTRAACGCGIGPGVGAEGGVDWMAASGSTCTGGHLLGPRANIIIIIN